MKSSQTSEMIVKVSENPSVSAIIGRSIIITLFRLGGWGVTGSYCSITTCEIGLMRCYHLSEV